MDHQKPSPARSVAIKRDLHQGWEPTCVAMAKCDMCSRAGRGVIYKCVQCKLSTCRECCESGQLDRDSRHALDPASVSWDPPPRGSTAAGSSSKRALESPNKPPRRNTRRIMTRSSGRAAALYRPPPEEDEDDDLQQQPPPPPRQQHHHDDAPVLLPPASIDGVIPAHTSYAANDARMDDDMPILPSLYEQHVHDGHHLHQLSPCNRRSEAYGRPYDDPRSLPPIRAWFNPEWARGDDHPPPLSDPAPSVPELPLTNAFRTRRSGVAISASVAAATAPPPPPPPPREPPLHDQLSAELARSVYANYTAQQNHHSVPPVDMHLRHDILTMWVRHMIASTGALGAEDALALFSHVAHDAAARLGLDPIRNGATDWLCELHSLVTYIKRP